MNLSIITPNSLILFSYILVMAWIVNKHHLIISYVDGIWGKYMNQIGKKIPSVLVIDKLKQERKRMINHLFINALIISFCWVIAAIILQILLLRTLPLSFLSRTLITFPFGYGLLLTIAILLNGFLYRFRPFYVFYLKQCNKKYFHNVVRSINDVVHNN